MQNRHFTVWPAGRPYRLEPADTSVYETLVATAGRYPDAPAIIYYDTVISFAELLDEVQRLAGTTTALAASTA